MRIIISLFLMLIISMALFGTTIYQIQYTTNTTGASPLVNTVVTTEGIVTGTGFTGGKYVIADAAGAWNAIFISDTAHTPLLGDKVSITGTVIENSDGQTEISSITAYSVVSSGNTIPAATPVNISDIQVGLTYGEPYESVLIKLTNVRTATAPISGHFAVAVNTADIAQCHVYDGFLTPQPYAWNNVLVGQSWLEIKGIVSYKGGRFRINPRTLSDMVRPPEITLKATTYYLNGLVAKGSVASVNILVPKLESFNIYKYEFKVGFNRRILRFEGFDIDSTLTQSTPDYDLSSQGDSVTVYYTSASQIISTVDDKQLVKLLFKVESYGDSEIKFDLNNSFFNDSLEVVLSSPCMIKVPIEKKIAWLSVYKDDLNTKNIFNPWLGQKITIEYGSLMQTNLTPVPPAPKVIIRIYDVQGRLVATPVNKNLADSDGIEILQWDGRDRNGNLLPIGVYYCHFEMIDRVSGKSETAVQPIVVAAQLK